MKNFLIVLVIAFVFTSCIQKNKPITNEGFTLKVTAKNFPDSTKVYLFNRDIDKNIDSTYVINEEFEFSGKVDLTSLCYLNFYDKKNNALEPYNYFYLENSNITISGEYSNFRNAKVTGSHQSDLLAQFKAIEQNNPKEEVFTKQINFIFSNPNNQVTLTQLLYRKKYVTKDSLLVFYNKLDSLNANSKKGKELEEYANAIDIKVGDKYREITGKDLNGVQHKLSDHLGRVILLDFWGTGCAPCRKQNKLEFPKLLQKYSSDDFVIISYSLDTKEEWWKKASKEDKISWLNISDLKGMKSENVKKYAVTALPNSFLIDENGTVVKSFLGFIEGESNIEKEIDKLLK